MVAREDAHCWIGQPHQAKVRGMKESIEEFKKRLLSSTSVVGTLPCPVCGVTATVQVLLVKNDVGFMQTWGSFIHPPKQTHVVVSHETKGWLHVEQAKSGWWRFTPVDAQHPSVVRLEGAA